MLEPQPFHIRHRGRNDEALKDNLGSGTMQFPRAKESNAAGITGKKYIGLVLEPWKHLEIYVVEPSGIGVTWRVGGLVF